VQRQYWGLGGVAHLGCGLSDEETVLNAQASRTDMVSIRDATVVTLISAFSSGFCIRCQCRPRVYLDVRAPAFWAARWLTGFALLATVVTVSGGPRRVLVAAPFCCTCGGRRLHLGPGVTRGTR